MKTNKISHYIGIDLGTNNTKIFVKKHGIIFDEASIIAIDTDSNNKIIAIGNKAKKIVGKSAKNIVLQYPVKNGVITDIALALKFINEVFKMTGYESYLKNSYVVISCTNDINKTEKDGLVALSTKFGAKYCEIQESSKLGLIGSGQNILDSEARLILDLGAGKASGAIIAANQILASRNIKLGGNFINEEIIKFVRSFHDLSIGNTTAENIKTTIGSLDKRTIEKDMLVFGRDITTRLPKEVYVNGDKISKIMIYVYQKIGDIVSELLGEIRSDAIKDIIFNGLYIVGGGSKTAGIKEFFSEFLKTKVIVNKNAENLVIIGAEKYESILLNNYNGIYNDLNIETTKSN